MIKKVIIACCLLSGSLMVKAQKTELPVSSKWMASAAALSKTERDQLGARLFNFKLDFSANTKLYNKENVLVSIEESTASEHEHYDLKNKKAQFISLVKNIQDATIKKVTLNR